MANQVVYSHDFSVDAPSWVTNGVWLEFQTILFDIHTLRLDVSLVGETTIKLITPLDKEILIVRNDELCSIVYDGVTEFENIPLINSNGVPQIKIDFDSEASQITFNNSETAILELPSTYYLYELSIQGDKIDIYLERDIIAGDFDDGKGHNSLKTYATVKDIKTEPGYFYIENQEYYLFNSMSEALDVNPGEVDYTPGNPYFVIPSGFIVNPDLGVIKTPQNIDYDMTWEEQTSGKYIPIPSGTLPDHILVYETSEDVPKISSFISEPTTTLVLTNEDQTISTVSGGAIWVDSTVPGKPFQFFAYINDQSGAPIEGVDTNFYYMYEDTDTKKIIKSDAINSTTDDLGVATCEIPVGNNWKEGFWVWIETATKKSRPVWIATTIKQTIALLQVFQLDNAGVKWDTQAAKTAMGETSFSDFWHKDTFANSLDAATTDYEFAHESTEAIYNTYTRADWENDNIQLRRPPINIDINGSDADIEIDATFLENGNFNIWDYCQVPPSGIIGSGSITDVYDTYNSVYPDMRVSVDGYWGQFLLSGAEIQAAPGTIDCVNRDLADTYYITRTEDYDGIEEFGEQGTFDTVESDVTALYDNLLYVFFYAGTDYLTLDYATLRNDILSGAAECYFRGVAIYPVLLPNINDVEAFNQDWTIQNLISRGKINL